MLLKRLSQKPGVQSTLILARENGAIVRASGLISSSSSSASLNPSDSHQSSGQIGYFEDNRPSSAAGGENGESSNRAEEVARIVWNFMETAAGLINDLNGEDDEMKLLRLRTKKNELVIVPGELFVLSSNWNFVSSMSYLDGEWLG